MDPTVYFQDINIPDVWKSYLSSNGITILRSMVFYKKILDLTSTSESLDNAQFMQYKNNNHNRNFSVTSHVQSWNDQSQNCKDIKIDVLRFR